MAESIRVVLSDGTIKWFNPFGQLHRTDGPAVEWWDGTKKWLQNDKFHREDGPAIIEPDGTKKWFQNGKFHRTDGPAIIRSDGTRNGINLIFGIVRTVLLLYVEMATKNGGGVETIYYSNNGVKNLICQMKKSQC